MPPSPVSVAVLVDLYRTPAAGGHIKTWERLTEAAAVCRGRLDLTVYVLGARERVDPVAPNARFVSLPAVLGTGPVSRRLGRRGDATDLAPYHPRLARHLHRHDVWQITHSFAFARTATRLAPRLRRPLVAAIQTDVPHLGRIYSRQLVGRLPSPCARKLAERLGVDRLTGEVLRRRRDGLLRSCDHLLVANDADEASMAPRFPAGSVSRMRRGVDTARFDPARRDRERLARVYGVPEDRPVVLFAGRADPSKDVLTVARAVHALGDRAHLFVAGDGTDLPRIRALVGPAATLPGVLPQDELAWIYPSCDVFAFPSRTETIGNVVAEAMASGLPALVPADASTAQWLAAPGVDGVAVAGRSPEAWVAALDPLIDDPAGRRAMGLRARSTVETQHPSWSEVLAEDLLPVWWRLARGDRPETPAAQAPLRIGASSPRAFSG
ncbi:MAG: glycosyltransferase [Pseudonocardia sp.]|nr:glycosyltransferase [Pseudonocardia sp.]